jgi:hypothetical protein
VSGKVQKVTLQRYPSWVALILIIAASDGIAAQFNNLEIIVLTIISKLFLIDKTN